MLKGSYTRGRGNHHARVVTAHGGSIAVHATTEGRQQQQQQQQEQQQHESRLLASMHITTDRLAQGRLAGQGDVVAAAGGLKKRKKAPPDVAVVAILPAITPPAGKGEREKEKGTELSWS